MTTTDPLPVEQCDRDAAADFFATYDPDRASKGWLDNIRQGKLWKGEHPLAIAMAQHRLATRPQHDEIERLRDDVRIWKGEAADRSQGMVNLNLDRAAMAVENMQLKEARDTAERRLAEAREALQQIEAAPAWGYPERWETTPAEVRQLARHTLTQIGTQP